jgi:hypothetical protein
VIISSIEDGRVAANAAEYRRLRGDPCYTDVRFNPRTGGLVATHRDHCFDPTVGRFGIPRGDYERIAAEVLFGYGRCVVLHSENKQEGVKTPEGTLDGKLFDIKGVEGTGKRNIVGKISDASRQGAEVVVLYFHDASMLDKWVVVNAYKGYLKLSKQQHIQAVFCVADGKLHKISV